MKGPCGPVGAAAVSLFLPVSESRAQPDVWHHRHTDQRRSARRGASGSGRTHEDRKSTRLNSSHGYISYAVFCLKKKKNYRQTVGPIPNGIKFARRRFGNTQPVHLFATRRS